MMNKEKNDSGYIFWSAAIIICSVLAVFSLMFASCSKGAAEPSPSQDAAETDASGEPAQSGDPQQSASPDVSEPVTAATRLAETEDMGQEYIDKFTFLGDSTTNGLYAYNVIPGARVWTPASGTLTLNLWSTATVVMHDDGTELSIADAVAAHTPEYMVITLGVNGVSFLTEEAFKTEYTNLVKAIQTASPNTKIILNSIYPTCSDYKYKDEISLEKINAANGWIEEIAGDCGVHFIYSYEAVAGEDGYLPADLSNGDGIHLNTDGYNKVIDYIRTHGWQ
jgi:lysophospholipase L1-like esterase